MHLFYTFLVEFYHVNIELEFFLILENFIQILIKLANFKGKLNKFYSEKEFELIKGWNTTI